MYLLGRIKSVSRRRKRNVGEKGLSVAGVGVFQEWECALKDER